MALLKYGLQFAWFNKNALQTSAITHAYAYRR